MSDTGDEFDETYETVEETKLLCKKHNIEFTFITNDMGYHKGDWQSLTHFYKAKSAVGSKAYPKICSQRLKIDVIYNYFEKLFTPKLSFSHLHFAICLIVYYCRWSIIQNTLFIS